MADYDYLFKLIIIGASDVGKSCLSDRFLEKEYKEISKPTTGVEYASKTVDIKDKQIKLQLWDTAGGNQYKTIVSAYYRGLYYKSN